MSEKKACATVLHEVTSSDLPLSCPMKNQNSWDAHPRVYLPIEEKGRVTCPYCNVEYVMKLPD